MASAAGSAGAAARLRPSAGLQLLGSATLPASGLAFFGAVNGRPRNGDEFLATAVIEIADRIEVLNGDPGNRTPEIRAQIQRLKTLAQSIES